MPKVKFLTYQGKIFRIGAKENKQIKALEKKLEGKKGINRYALARLIVAKKVAKQRS